MYFHLFSPLQDTPSLSPVMVCEEIFAVYLDNYLTQDITQMFLVLKPVISAARLCLQ